MAPTDASSSTGEPPAVEIRVEDLSKSFDRRRVLCDVNLQIKRGELVALVGGSGSGKTVLMRHIVGHFRPDSGRVLVADHEAAGAPLRDITRLSELQLDRLRRHWAVVFQHNALFSGTVFDNIALALREVKGMADGEIGPIATTVLGAVGLDAAHVMSVDRDQLSGGMAKRVAIARALALDPVLLFYDEPTTGLDPHLAMQIQNLIYDIHLRPAGDGLARTTLVITHDKDLLFRLQPRIVLLDRGRVGFDGTFAEFESTNSAQVRPYIERMEALQYRQIVG